MSKEKGNVIKFPRNMRSYMRLVEQAGIEEQADADYGYGIHPATFGRRNGETFTDHGRADLKIRPNDARFGDNPLAGPGEGASLEEFADTDMAPQLDQLHQALTKAGLSDLEIRQGVDLTDNGKQKIAGKFGVAPEDVDLLMNSLVQKLRDTDSDDTDALLSDYYGGMGEGSDAPIWSSPSRRRSTVGETLDEPMSHEDRLNQDFERPNRRSAVGETLEDDMEPMDHQDRLEQDFEHPYHRDDGVEQPGERGHHKPFNEGTILEKRFSVEPDALGNVTIRDNQSGKEKFIQGSAATAILDKLENGADSDQTVGSLMEADMNVENDDTGKSGFADEINADSGSYNFTWNYSNQNGTGTVLYRLKDKRPDFKMISVRTMEGDDILDRLSGSEYKQILGQAKKFIQDA